MKLDAQQDNTATSSLGDPGQVTALWVCRVLLLLSEGCKFKCLQGAGRSVNGVGHLYGVGNNGACGDLWRVHILSELPILIFQA